MRALYLVLLLLVACTDGPPETPSESALRETPAPTSAVPETVEDEPGEPSAAYAPADTYLEAAEALSGSDPEAAARAYFAEAEVDDVEVETIERGEDRLVVLVTLSGLLDDSITAERLQLVYAPEPDGRWTLTEVGRQVRCWEGRGHPEWSPAPCL
ncbi:MAG: hypothetical protein HKN04_02510 [Rhodothermaceae bacterium]|nr:hypothetical protein [Rhodothermaceae bacterium]